MVLDGIRAAESSIRANYFPIWHHPSFKCISMSPIFYWSDSEVREYAETIGFPIDRLKRLGTSPECWCGAYKSKSDFTKLYHECPELFNKLADLERNNKTGYTFVYESNRKISLDEIKEKC